MTRVRYFPDLTGPQVAERLTERSILVQPLGAIEQHGPHLPLSTDSVIAAAVADRACVLAALESVSLVVLFDEPTPVDLLERVRPQLYVKGGDYDIEALEETRRIRRWGGDARALSFVDGYSTTSLVRRIRS